MITHSRTNFNHGLAKAQSNLEHEWIKTCHRYIGVIIFTYVKPNSSSFKLLVKALKWRSQMGPMFAPWTLLSGMFAWIKSPETGLGWGHEEKQIAISLSMQGEVVLRYHLAWFIE